MMPDPCDLLIIGGGVNGAGIARDAAGRGLSVVLCEKGDLAAGTSSRSSKLIHGGLRYLEYFEFRLVREALAEREVLLRAAPHIVRPMRFVLPHSGAQRPAWMVRAGLFLYDHLGRRDVLPGTRRLDLSREPQGVPLHAKYRLGFEYSDCWVDDSRLVVLNAVDAAARGADIRLRTELQSARRIGTEWEAVLRAEDGTMRTLRARALVNAAGPWVHRVGTRILGAGSGRRVRLVKGSHIIVRKFWAGEHAYVLQNDDRRIVFVLPYEGHLALIGTTDIPYDGCLGDVTVGDDERDYLRRAVGGYMTQAIGADDIAAEFAGVRPLADDDSTDPAAVSRDYALDLDGAADEVPLLSVFGGKITTYRKLAEHALGMLRPFLPRMAGAWTRDAPLPGGAIPNADFAAWAAALVRRFPGLPPPLVQHYARLYGSRADQLLDGVRSPADLGRHFGGTLHAREAEFLRRTEWARDADDVLHRRTRHSLHLTREQRDDFGEWFAGK